MKKYIEVAKISFKNEMIYKFDVLVNVLLSIFKIILAYILWKAIYLENNQVAGFTFSQMITYYIIINFFSNIDKSDDIVWQLSDEIKGGKFTKYLVSPVKPLLYFLSASLAKTMFIVVINMIVTVGFMVLFSNYVAVQFTLPIVLSCIGITFLALIFTGLMNYFIGILSFKFKNVNGFNMIKSMVLQLITGTLVPIALFPELVKQLIQILPFPYLYSTASMLFINGDTSIVPLALGVLAVWNVLMFVIVRITYRIFRKDYEGVGI